MAVTKKKYQIFISSTYTDLIEERQAAVEAILKAGHIPAGMELFKAGNDQLVTIKKWIDESDVYLLILGNRYGSIDQNTGLSYTELEYRYAIDERKMPVFAIILDDSIANEKVKKGFNKENIFEIENPKKYNEFVGYVKTKIVCFAKNLSEIKLSIHENINQFEEAYNLIGWIKGNNVIDTDTLNDLNELRKENNKLNIENQELRNEINGKFSLSLADLNSEISIEVPYYFDRSKRNKAINITWSRLFSLIAPEIISYQNDSHVHIELSKFLFSLLGLSSSCKSSIIDQQLFYTIRTQLIAYGLIKVQSLKTTNGSTALFWILSDRGNRLMMDLRTIKE